MKVKDYEYMDSDLTRIAFVDSMCKTLTKMGIENKKKTEKIKIDIEKLSDIKDFKVDNNDKPLLQYYYQIQKGRENIIDIYKNDISTLDPEALLNDIIIFFYLK